MAVTVPVRATPPEHALPFLKVQGQQIVTPEGKPVFLRGFQGLGFYPIPPGIYMRAVEQQHVAHQKLDAIAKDLSQYRLSDEDIREIKTSGANVVRIWFSLYEIQKNPYQYSPQALEQLVDTVNRFGREGIYSILVLGKVGQNPYPTSDHYLKRGKTLWDKSSGLWDQTVKQWGIIAKRLSNTPYIAGYDLINEPVAPSKRALHDYYTDVIREIRAHDSRHILFLEIDNLKKQEFQLGGMYDDNNTAVSFHYYYPHDFTLPAGVQEYKPGRTYPGGPYCAHQHAKCTPRMWNKETLDTILRAALEMKELRGKPVLVGEFGANSIRDNEGAITWIRDMLTLMNQYNLHYTYHNYRLTQPYGYYWILNKDTQHHLKTMLSRIISGEIKYSEITEEQKKQITTHHGYHRREGIRPLLQKAFTETK